MSQVATVEEKLIQTKRWKVVCVEHEMEVEYKSQARAEDARWYHNLAAHPDSAEAKAAAALADFQLKATQ